MICQNCNDKEALYERSIETGVGGSVTIFVCQDCARKLDYLQKSKPTAGRRQENQVSQKFCPECGTRQDVFVRSNYAGCSSCYEVFSSEVDSFLERYHGKTSHVGKIPESLLKRVPRDVELDELAQKMARAMQDGDHRAVEKARQEFFKNGGRI